MKGQLTVRGLVIGCIGCLLITASSAYVALKLGALPWPIVFAALVSLFFLKAVSRGTSSLNEANVTHTVMSAGAMVAGGLAFTIPAAWMLGLADQVSLTDLTLIAMAGVLLGLACTALLRVHFIEGTRLEFPIGQAAAQTLIAGESGGKTGAKLFSAMGVAGAFTFLRDGIAVIPSMFAAIPIPGVAFGVYASPMMLSVGFLVGTGAVLAWFAGAVLANFCIITGGTAAGLIDLQTAQGIVSSLGMGVMIGSGFAVIARDILPKGVLALKSASVSRSGSRSPKRTLIILLITALALAAAILLGLPPTVAALVVLATFVACAMSAQSVGQTGIDPMEVFGVIVLLIVSLFADVPQVQLIFVAALVAVACGLAGDVMNDFEAGHVLGTNPKAQIIGQAIGGMLGALVSVGVLHVLFSAYGPDAFGPQGEFVAAQASVVANLVSGVPSVGAFAFGIAAGFVLYLLRFPAMMLGLGIYLPFYLSLTAFLGAMCKPAYDALCRMRARNAGLEGDELESALAKSQESGLIVASGLLGGESFVGIVLALLVTLASVG